MNSETRSFYQDLAESYRLKQERSINANLLKVSFVADKSEMWIPQAWVQSRGNEGVVTVWCITEKPVGTHYISNIFNFFANFQSRLLLMKNPLLALASMYFLLKWLTRPSV